MEERLDRFLCNPEWGLLFKEECAVNLDSWTSDHCPVMMHVKERKGSGEYRSRSTQRLHYEDMWTPYDECQAIIEKEWSRGITWNGDTAINNFTRAAARSMTWLKKWSKEEFGGRKRKLEKLLNMLRQYKEESKQCGSGNEIKLIEKQIDDFLMDEEVYWKQWARADC